MTENTEERPVGTVTQNTEKGPLPHGGGSDAHNAKDTQGKKGQGAQKLKQGS